MKTIRILNICFGIGGIILLLAITFSNDTKSSSISKKITKVFFILGNLVILGSLIGKYMIGNDVITSFIMFVIADYAIWKTIKNPI